VGCRELCDSEEEWQALVARNLKADSGWDLQDLAHFCAVMAAEIVDTAGSCLQPSKQFGVQRILHVLHGVLEVLQQHKPAVASLNSKPSHGSSLASTASHISCLAGKIRAATYFGLRPLVEELVGVLKEVKLYTPGGLHPL
jgi:hypothetical protein